MSNQPAGNVVARRSILTSASSVCLLVSLLTPAFALPSADCQWAPDDPVAVVQSCTAQLSVEKAPASWMYFNRGLAFKGLGKLDEAHLDYPRPSSSTHRLQRRTPTAATFESSATMSTEPWPISERHLRSTQTTT